MAYDDEGNLVPDPIPASVVLGEAVSEHPVLANLKEQIAKLEKDIEESNRSKDYYMKIATERGNQNARFENALRTTLVELYGDDEISDEAAKKIAEACEIEVTKSISIQGTINFSGSIDVSIFEDLDDISYNVNVDGLDISAYGETLWHLDYDVEDVTSEDN